VALAHGNAGANRADANADLIRQGRPREGANSRSNQQKLLHGVSPSSGMEGKRPMASAVPMEPA
jgi:hypothetical protein